MARPNENRAPRDRDRNRQTEGDSDIVEKLVHINRVAKVVKGGRRFGFAALVVVGDQKGRVGFGHGKAREVPEAIRKATEEAKRRWSACRCAKAAPCTTTCEGRHGAGKVMLRAAPPGTGIIAGGPMRAVSRPSACTTSWPSRKGSSNPYNMVRATFDALKGQSSPRQIANKRGKKVADIITQPWQRLPFVRRRARSAANPTSAPRSWAWV
jgi:small subunit ribosomal protein S5